MSRITYGSNLSDLCNYISDDMPIESITSLDLIRYMADVDSRDEIQSPVTYNKYIKVLRTFFNWCVKMDLIEKSPAKVLKVKNARHSVPKVKAMPDGVLYRLIDAAEEREREDNDPRPLALILFLSDTGCRIGGAATLTRDRLKLNDPIVVRNHQRIYTVQLFEKGREEPNIYYFSEETAKVLRRWLINHSGPYVFGNNGQSIEANNLARYFRRFGKGVGCGSWGPHSLRHRKGHQAAKQFPLSIGAKLLNNSEEVFVKYYMPKQNQFVQEAAAQLFSNQIKNKQIIDLNGKTG